MIAGIGNSQGGLLRKYSRETAAQEAKDTMAHERGESKMKELAEHAKKKGQRKAILAGKG